MRKYRSCHSTKHFKKYLWKNPLKTLKIHSPKPGQLHLESCKSQDYFRVSLLCFHQYEGCSWRQITDTYPKHHFFILLRYIICFLTTQFIRSPYADLEKYGTHSGTILTKPCAVSTRLVEVWRGSLAHLCDSSLASPVSWPWALLQVRLYIRRTYF